MITGDAVDMPLLVERGSMRDVEALLPFLRSRERGVEAVRAVDAIVARSTPADLEHFEATHRVITWADPWAAWTDLHVDAAMPRSLLGVASFHGNGFLRERAVALLALQTDGFELPFLLIRCNDWVDRVHEVALAAAAARVQSSYAAHWLRCAALLDPERDIRRRQDALTGVRARVLRLLAEPRHDGVVKAAAVSGDAAVARMVLELARALPDVRAQPLLLAATKNPNGRVARVAARTLLGRSSRELLAPFAQAAMADARRTLRVVGVEAWAKLHPSEAEPRLRAALLDPARVVREQARYELPRCTGTPFDAKAFYRAALAEAGRPALEGLAEVGDASDLPLFRTVLDDPKPAVRAAAVMGIGRNAESADHPRIAAALRDPSRLVRRAARPYARRLWGRGQASR
jgi:hypothetical protein